jgi:UDP-N-acetylmuramyl pentapeptide phosphotransferase/UDP-N-acetylglucosamine-1-phosphate transferase
VYFLLKGFCYPWFFAGLTLIAIISFADDNRPQSSKVRLTVHLAAMLLLFFQLELFSLPWYVTVSVLIFCIGMINAYNFMDGINGITGGYSMVVLGALWYINTYQVPFIDNNLIYVSLIAVSIFNYFNFRKKARCFSGDVGAISMAFILVFIITTLIFKTGDLGYLALLTVYGVDSVLTIVHRIILKENIFKPHRKHMYQLMANELKIPHVAVSVIYCTVQAFISAGLIMTTYKLVYAIGSIVFFSVVYIVFMKRFFYLHKR